MKKIIFLAILIITSIYYSQAQKTYFSLSQLNFYTYSDTTDNENKTFVNLNIKVSSLSIPASINIEFGETIKDFTLFRISGSFVKENNNYFINIDNRNQAIYGKSINIRFEVPKEIIDKWKFSRVYIDLKTGGRSEYVYHRW